MMNERKQSLWKQGKNNYKEFLDINFKKFTNFKIIFFGMLITALIILPFCLLLMQIWNVYHYNVQLNYLVVAICFVILMLCNGLSNLFTIKLAKLYSKERENVLKVDEWSIFFYQTLNPGFAFFVIVVFIIFGVMI